MLNRNQISLFVVSFLFVGILFLVLPEKGYSELGCCLILDELSAVGCVGCKNPASEQCAVLSNACQGQNRDFSEGKFCTGKAGLPNDTECKSTQNDEGCCTFNDGSCLANISLDACSELTGSVSWNDPGLDECFSANNKCQRLNEGPSGRSVEIPTLGQWGLIALAAALGIVGTIIYLRRKAAA